MKWYIVPLVVLIMGLSVGAQNAADAGSSNAPSVVPEVKEVEPTAVGARELAQQEELRRKALEIQAAKSEKEGDQAMSAGDYAGAIKAYESARLNQPEGGVNTVALRERCREQILKANQALAQAALKKNNADDARRYAQEMLKLSPADKRATRILASAEKIKAAPVGPEKTGKIKIAKQPEVIAKKKSQKQLIDEGRQYFEVKDYDRAEALFDKVLLEDPYNTDAMRFLRRIGDVRFNITSLEREATVADMMNRVRDSWNPHTRKETTLPLMVQKPGSVEPSDVSRTREKLKNLIIPSLEFRSANISDVVDFLSKASAEQDNEDHTGVNILLKLGETTATPPTAEGGAPATPPATTSITLNLRKVSLLDAIKYITEYANLSYRIDKNVVIILPRGFIGNLMTRMYPISQAAINSMVEKAASAPVATGPVGGIGGGVRIGEGLPTAENKTDVRGFFESAGVPFPVGTSITYNPAVSKLIVANTPENIEKVESILAEFDVATKQVEIETRFVEVQQNQLEELGMQLMLTDNFEIANKKGSGSMLGRERIQINKNPDGVTKGLRFFNDVAGKPTLQAIAGTAATPLGNVLTFASVLTNPELQVIVNALSQSGNTDVLSAPRVTTKVGEQATIKVVREIRYPQSYEPSQIQVNNPNQGGLGNNQNLQVTVFAPADFQTREVGVILNVTPTVGPDGYTIDLTLVPEVSELVDWVQYGTQTGTNQNFNASQPIFSTRTITSKLVVWDGETVVMGGLISEALTTVKDKIPILGDIPLVGRLFRSEGHSSEKKNLMIFVTARIVDSSGRPIHKKEHGTTMRQTVETSPSRPANP